MDPKSIYKEEVLCERLVSFIAGLGEEQTSLSEMLAEGGILGAFAQNNDIQQITVTSTNIGMVRRYTKSYKEQDSADANQAATEAADPAHEVGSS